MANQAQFNIYLNGGFLPAHEAQISVMDRGFLFGDGVYEVIPCYNGRLFRLKHHLDRLDQSLSGIRMASSTTRWSKNGCRHSNPWAIEAISTFVIRSHGK